MPNNNLGSMLFAIFSLLCSVRLCRFFRILDMLNHLGAINIIALKMHLLIPVLLLSLTATAKRGHRHRKTSTCTETTVETSSVAASQIVPIENTTTSAPPNNLSITLLAPPTPTITITPSAVPASVETTSTSILQVLRTTTVSSTTWVQSTSTTMPTAATPGCISLSGGVQPDAKVESGCGAMLAHIDTCANQNSPWETPYDTNQSFAFQACVCETSDKPFTEESGLFVNFTGCAHCLVLEKALAASSIVQQSIQIENFCRSQNPNAFLFITTFLDWLCGMSGDTAVDVVLDGVTSSLQSLFTTTPPLANLAYGASAPPGGSLAGVTPSLMTFTKNGNETVTSLVTWIPTKTGDKFNSASASASAAAQASEDVTSRLCMGRGPCSISNSSRQRPHARFQWLELTFMAFWILGAR